MAGSTGREAVQKIFSMLVKEGGFDRVLNKVLEQFDEYTLMFVKY